MKSSTFLTALFAGLTLSMAACQPTPRLSEEQLASCAIYEAALLELESIFASAETIQPITFALVDPNIVIEQAPDWDDWNVIIRGSERSGDLSQLEAFRGPYVQLSDCSMRHLSDWQRIEVDLDRYAWVLPPSPGDGLVVMYTNEFAFSRVYLSQDQSFAIVRIEPTRLDHLNMFDPFRGHLTPPDGYMRLERGSDGEWAVTGHHPYRR